VADNQNSPSELKIQVKGLPMITSDPQALAKEKTQLELLEKKGFFQRWRGYTSLTGPGWLQSALTLGGGSAIASLFAGSYLQYQLLWVQPVAMLLGIIVLYAISYQTLSTSERPFLAIKRILHPVAAWIWACGALLATIIWHFPQYALAAGMTEDMVKAATGWEPTPTGQTLFLIAVGLIVLMVSTWITWNYGKGHKGIRFYEKLLKSMVWIIIIAFSVVVLRRTFDGGVEWGKVLKGFLPLNIPKDKHGITIVMAAFGAAVGINSTFLFPYTLLARGWGKSHLALSRFDLITGTLIPFCLITSLIVIAAGSTIYDPTATEPTRLTPVDAAKIFESAGLGVFLSRIVFGLGIIGMALSTLTVHMLMCGFAACELLKIEPSGWKYKLACLLPIPGVSGVIIWKYMGPWIAVSTSAICGLLLPFAYVIFLILQNNRSFLGSACPTGLKALAWNVSLSLALLVSLASAGYFLYAQFA